MSDRGRYESAMFWLAFGTASAVIGLALMTIGVTRSAPGASLFASLWFVGGLGLLALGALLLLWALLLYVVRRRVDPDRVDHASAGSDRKDMVEAVRGYYAERGKLFDIWERQQRSKGRKS